jgi:hypothetical protein
MRLRGNDGEGMARDDAEDRIDAIEILHDQADADLHFRFIGTARGRQFILNVQFASADAQTKERLRTEEYDFIIGKILTLGLDRIATTPNPWPH